VSIIIISLLAGLFVNFLYGYLGYDIMHWAHKGSHEEAGVVSIIASIVLSLLVVKSFLPSRHTR
jgi:hypothetical protein